MKKSVFLFICVPLLLSFASCATTGGKTKKVYIEGKAKYTEILDHKNQKWGKEIPEWVAMEKGEIEKAGKYGNVYVFKFESEKGADLEGTQMWLKNFTAASEVVRLISQRVEDRVASGAEGNKDAVASFSKELVRIVSEFTINGFKRESDYWVLQRFFTADKEVEGDFYSAYMLYTIDKQVLDAMIKEAIKKANDNVPVKTEEEKDIRNTVMKAFEKGL